MSTVISNVNPTHITQKECSEERKCLGMLQQNKQKQSVLMLSDGNVKVLSSGGKKRKSDENSSPVKQRRLDGIYVDPKPLRKKKKSLTSVGIQTDETRMEAPKLKETDVPNCSSSDDKTEKILQMLTSDTAPSDYWELLAEKRREALEETLIENKSLHEENKTLKTEVKKLKDENKLLDEMVKEAKELAELVESFTGGAATDGE